ncbi:hypothetical protein ZEAMMB73_Zm00001d047710 [Zea mays]|uniref:Uncharacterized protein n=1 Tax=Zea mays TaxID=4577 RepID=K7VJ38_MAIZE|nr:hypothetical protein ZEAMMB73_Zm00001d047710 [Zea mays]AQL07348.1 hypothetical protein ZEAMMB73_Zm00001d047710 [Zea mays]
MMFFPEAASVEVLAKRAALTYEAALPNGRGAARNVSKVMPSQSHFGMNMLISRVLESHGDCCKNSSKVRHNLFGSRLDCDCCTCSQ